MMHNESPHRGTLGKIIRFSSWPVMLGFITGLIMILSTPSLRYSLGGYLYTMFVPPSHPLSYAKAVSKAAPSVVSIFSQKEVQTKHSPLFDDPLFRYYFNNTDIPRQKQISSALGSGVIINQEGYILTNDHVINDATEITVSLYDGRETAAIIVGSDPETDLAVLKISLENLTGITLGEPQKARAGDIVLAIGNPFNLEQTVSQGIISATGRHGLGINVYENFLQTDAAINRGNSGGPLIDVQGQLVGINAAVLNNQQGHAVGIGFAIPADMAIAVMKDIIVSGRAIRGWLGIEARTLNESTSNNNGVLISGIYPNGPADKAGIRTGDIVTHINHTAITHGREGINLMAEVEPGDQVQVTIQRNNKQLKLNAVAGVRPESH